MIRKKLYVLLGILFFSMVAAHADITITSQNLDEFSFKKGGGEWWMAFVNHVSLRFGVNGLSYRDVWL